MSIKDGGGEIVTYYFTSITMNYFAKARVLCKTLKQFNVDAKFLVAVSDIIPKDIEASKEPFDYIFSTRGLKGIDNMDIFYFKHNITELCTAVKPMVALHIFKTYGADKVIYLDPDIAVFDSLFDLEAYLDNSSMIFTPHQLVPEEHDLYVKENEILFLKRGANNLGFFGVKNDGEGLAFLKWWSTRLMHYCFDDDYILLKEFQREGLLGLFTDQKWIDLVPTLFDRYHIIKHPGYNVCTWNLSGRKINYDGKKYYVNGQPLYFFHFSGFDSGAHNNELNKSLSFYPHNADVKKLSKWYKAKLTEEGEDEYRKYEFQYSRYSTGEKIPNVDRKLLHYRKDIHHLIRNPFQRDEGFSFYHWARENYPQCYQKEYSDTDMKDSASFLAFFPYNSLRRNLLRRIYLLFKSVLG